MPIFLTSNEDAFRLLIAVVVNAALLAGAYRFVPRRFGEDFVSRWLDALLLYFLVQYVVIGVLGMAGVLAPATIGAGALLASALLWTVSKPRKPPPESNTELNRRERFIVIAGFVFAVGFVGAMVHYNRYGAPLANDAITYHLPAAAQWLRTGRLGLFETWFYNPANTYSPPAGSMFIAWLIAPFRSDIAARFVEVGPLLMIFFAMVAVCRRVGAKVIPAMLVAVAAVLARPFVSHVNLSKDDLFVAAFFLSTLVSLSKTEPRSRLWLAIRTGVALGLMLATKYTALMTLPLLLLMVDAPARAGWRWRHVAFAVLIAIVLAGPWYCRNLLLTGNPLFPTDVSLGGTTLFRGLMTVTRSDRLSGPMQWWQVMTTGYYPIPAIGLTLLFVGWAAAWHSAKRLKREPLLRVILIGAPLGIALFLLTSPYAEMRFVYPSLLLLFAACAVAASALKCFDWIATGVLCVVSVATSFASDYLQLIITFVLAGVVVSAVTVGLIWMAQRLPTMLRRLVGGVATCVILAGACVAWGDYARQYRTAPDQNWTHPNSQYRQFADAWSYVRNQIPPRQAVAYTNLYLVYPLMGFNLDRPIVYAPTNAQVKRLADLPHFATPTSGENIPQHMEDISWQSPDGQAWLTNLRASGATHLVVGIDSIARPGMRVNPPELAFIRANPDTFRLVFRDEAILVSHVRRPD